MLVNVLPLLILLKIQTDILLISIICFVIVILLILLKIKKYINRKKIQTDRTIIDMSMFTLKVSLKQE